MEGAKPANEYSGSEADTRNSAIFTWTILACAFAVRIAYVYGRVHGHLFDDGYVTLRYAANLVHGIGFVYNPGERVLGTTSPLFAWMLAGAGKIAGVSHLEEIALGFGIAGFMGAMYLSDLSLLEVGVPRIVRHTFLCALAFLPAFLGNSTSGMETPLVLFVMALSLWLYIRGRLLAIGGVAILLFLLRIDTAIWLLALGLAALTSAKGRDRLKLVAPICIFIVGVVAWMAFTKSYFGVLIPQSLVGKAVSHGAFVAPNWRYVLEFASAFVPVGRFGVLGLAAAGAALVMLTVVAIHICRRYEKLRPIVFFVYLYGGIFLAAHAPLFSWYQIPEKWAFYAIAILGFWDAGEYASAFFRWSKTSAIAALVLVDFVVLIVGARAIADHRREGPNPFWALSDLVESTTAAQDRVFIEHIGLVGYRTGRYIYDYTGLVTPETIRLRKLYGPAWLTKAAREYNAELVVLYDADLPAIRSAGDEDAAWFRANYVEMDEPQLRQAGLWIFRKATSGTTIDR